MPSPQNPKPDYSPFSGTYSPFLQTARFDIFHSHIVRNPNAGHPRELFTAWERAYDGYPRPLCEVVLYPHPYGIFVEWVHVDEDHRRHGIATEVLCALRKKLGKLDLAGGSAAGDAFVAARAAIINNETEIKQTS
jgi:GNAT superfamily N-acetyltransferase